MQQQPQTVDRNRARQFAGQLVSLYTGGFLSMLIDIGHQTGLFAAAAEGPATSAGLADRAGLEERYVREWLGAMTTAGIMTYDAAAGTYTLPPEHALCLSGDTSYNLAPMSAQVAHTGKIIPGLVEAFRRGGGVPYSAYRPEFTEVMDGMNRRRYTERLIRGYLPKVSGLPERLAAGIRVADIGCGTGLCVNLMAQAYPASTFAGYDLAADAIARAQAEARTMGLSNARFEALDVTRLPAEPRFDLITAFDAIHDQAQPAAVLERISNALAPDGVFLMVEPKASSRLEDNIGNPWAPFGYASSVLHCLTVSLAEDGAGLGTMWGSQLAHEMLATAGFVAVEVADAPADPFNSIYACRK